MAYIWSLPLTDSFPHYTAYRVVVVLVFLATGQVIARPKLVTPTIYQHARSPANDHSCLGLGATTPPTTTRESARFRAGNKSRGSSTRQTPAGLTSGEDDHWLHDTGGRGGYTGRVKAWEQEEEGSQNEEQAREVQALLLYLKTFPVHDQIEGHWRVYLERFPKHALKFWCAYFILVVDRPRTKGSGTHVQTHDHEFGEGVNVAAGAMSPCQT